jgi:hypothetical protein
MWDMWEVLVPVSDNQGVPYSREFHKAWDSEVEKIVGPGITLLAPAKGRWYDTRGETIVTEGMIPVRIICTEGQIARVVDLTLAYYDQIEVLAYRVSDRIISGRKEGT